MARGGAADGIPAARQSIPLPLPRPSWGTGSHCAGPAFRRVDPLPIRRKERKGTPEGIHYYTPRATVAGPDPQQPFRFRKLSSGSAGLLLLRAQFIVEIELLDWRDNLASFSAGTVLYRFRLGVRPLGHTGRTQHNVDFSYSWRLASLPRSLPKCECVLSSSVRQTAVCLSSVLPVPLLSDSYIPSPLHISAQ